MSKTSRIVTAVYLLWAVMHKFIKNIHAYARHEFISSIGGLYELNDTQKRNTTVFRLDSEYMRDGSVFSQYRVRDGMSAREAEAAMGVT